MTDADIINELGGHRELAAALKVPPSVVWNWKNRRSGVSEGWRRAVADVAKRKRVKLPETFLEPPQRRAA